MQQILVARQPVVEAVESQQVVGEGLQAEHLPNLGIDCASLPVSGWGEAVTVVPAVVLDRLQQRCLRLVHGRRVPTDRTGNRFARASRFPHGRRGAT
ncbi:hypothetical protein BOH72_09600 [Mycobacterium sp. WY10]|nr:hypothetical protein BOH72_09600 [Mycobacterium sp. WY10]